MLATKEFLEAVVAGLTHETGVKIIFGDKWQVDVEERTLKFNQRDLLNLPISSIRGSLLHEIGHLLFTQSIKETSMIKKYGIVKMAAIYKPLEDLRIEIQLNHQYGNYAKTALALTNRDGVAFQIAQSHGDWTKLKKLNQFMLLILCNYCYLYDKDKDELLGHNLDKILWSNYGLKMSPEVVDKFKLYESKIKDIVLRYSSYFSTTKEMQDYADKELVPLVKEWLVDKPIPPQPPQPQSQPQASGNSGGQGQPQPKNKQKKPNKQQNQGSGQSKPDKKNEKNQGQEQNNQPDKKDSKGEGNNKPQPDDKQAPQGKPQPSNGTQQAEPEPTQQGNEPMDLVKSARGNKFGWTGGEPTVKIRLTEREARMAIRSYAITLAQRLSSILTEKAMTKWRGNHLRGKLLSKNAYKVCIPNESRIFSKKSMPDSPMYTVYLALDASGSMQGTKEANAFLGATLLSETSRILRFPIKFYQFENDGKRLSKLDDYCCYCGGTADYGVLVQINEDMKSDEQSLVFIVTDGAVREEDERKEYLTKIRKKKALIYGIGIGNGISLSDLKGRYDNPILVPQVQDLPKVLIEIMRKIIHR